MILIGLPEVMWLLSKAKEFADHVGHSQLLKLYKALIASTKISKSHFQNNNLLIAPLIMETMDATEVKFKVLMHTLRIMVFLLKNSILMLEDNNNVKEIMVTLK